MQSKDLFIWQQHQKITNVKKGVGMDNSFFAVILQVELVQIYTFGVIFYA